MTELLLSLAAASGTESLVEHRRRLGPVPHVDSAFSDVLARSGLRGRGGAGFPTGAKWAAVASRQRRRPVVLVNGAEGEPLSAKDRMLMAARPHLVIDGAILAARAVGADDVIAYVGSEHQAALQAMERAVAERRGEVPGALRVVAAPPGYVSGEETAAVHFVNDGIALPLSVPPRPFERGVAGRPTLVNNVETLVHAALIARFGDAWFRSVGDGGSAGSLLVTVSGGVAAPGVIEVAAGTTVGAAVTATSGLRTVAQAVLIGGYAGTWHTTHAAWGTRLDSDLLRSSGHALGCGAVHVLPAHACGVDATSRIVSYLADQSARQCGPCVFGLRAVAQALMRIAERQGDICDLERLQRWSGVLGGRGACRHPDGAGMLLRSALSVFRDDFLAHVQRRACALPLDLPLAV